MGVQEGTEGWELSRGGGWVGEGYTIMLNTWNVCSCLDACCRRQHRTSIKKGEIVMGSMAEAYPLIASCGRLAQCKSYANGRSVNLTQVSLFISLPV